MAGIKKQQGIVERVNVTELPEPEEFIHEGKTIVSTHRYGIKLEGIETWFNLGSGDKADLVFKDDDGKWQILGKGSEVLIKYVENTGKNGKTYFNTKKSQVTVIEMVPGEKQQPKAQAAAASDSAPSNRGTSNASGGVDWAKKDAGIEAGHAVNGAVALAAAMIQREAILPKDVLDYISHQAREIHSITRALQQQIQSGTLSSLGEPAKESPPPNPKPAPKKTTAKPAPPVEEDEWQDDDIPF